MNSSRFCSRPGCGREAVATLTYAYADQTAVVGPLAPEANPHSWDLCENHASRITAPHGWELLRVEHIRLDDASGSGEGSDSTDVDDLMALADLVGAVDPAVRVTSEVSGPGGDPIEYTPDFDGADPDNSNHPVFRMRRVADARAYRRSHLSVVRESGEQD